MGRVMLESSRGCISVVEWALYEVSDKKTGSTRGYMLLASHTVMFPELTILNMDER